MVPGNHKLQLSGPALPARIPSPLLPHFLCFLCPPSLFLLPEGSSPTLPFNWQTKLFFLQVLIKRHYPWEAFPSAAPASALLPHYLLPSPSTLRRVIHPRRGTCKLELWRQLCLAGGCPAKIHWPHLYNVSRDGVNGPGRDLRSVHRNPYHVVGLGHSLSSGSLLGRGQGLQGRSD